MSEALLIAEDVRRSFGRDVVLAGISIEVRRGEVLVILGPSGSGKTTLLNILAGFDRHAEYKRLLFDGRPITGACIDVAVIFQEDSLFPWLTLRQNVTMGERIRAFPRHVRDTMIDRYLHEFRLAGMGDKYPDQLSGGQRQRGAVARALINEPMVLLADEPFRALDSATRLSSQTFLWGEIKQRGCTLCLITHDIDEALLLGDRLVVLTDRPTRVGGSFEVALAKPRTVATVLSPEFLAEKQRFVSYCESAQLPLFPPVST